MAKLHVTQQEMLRAYSLHRHFYRATERVDPAMSRHLILCYAVECGLKYRLMRARNMSDTIQLKDALGLGLHHKLEAYLEVYLREARLPAQATSEPLGLAAHNAIESPPCRPNRQVQPPQYHEAFRYGVELEDETGLRDQLARVLAVLGDIV